MIIVGMLQRRIPKMKLSDEWILGLIVSMVIGSYGWASAVGLFLSTKIDKLISNHLQHIEERLKKLEDV